MAWTLYGLITSRSCFSRTIGVGETSLKQLLKDGFEFEHDFLPVAAAVHIEWILLFVFVFAYDLCGALVRVGDLVATKLSQPANIYNSIMYSLEFSLINLGYTHIQCVAYGALAHRLNAFWRGFNYVTNMEGDSDILFDSNIPEIQFFKSQ
ncbi:unnamed protein product [Brassica oleracea]